MESVQTLCSTHSPQSQFVVQFSHPEWSSISSETKGTPLPLFGFSFARVAFFYRKILPGVCAADCGWTVDTITMRVRGVGRVRPRHFADDDDASLAARRRHPGARVSVERVRSPGESTKRH